MKILHTQTKLLIKKLATLEKRGKYDNALSELEPLWENINDFPNTDSLDEQTAAELILRCGSLAGFIGLSDQIEDAQERSKNLLEEARQRFLTQNNAEKVAECENYLALAYWRTGELNEAEVFIAEALTHNLPASNRTRLYTYIIESKIDFAKKSFDKICRNFNRLQVYFVEYGDSFLKANFYNHLGLAQKNLGNLAAALPNIEKARDYFYKIKHYSFGAACENNLSQIYKLQKNFIKAREAIDGATNTFKRIKDKTRQGFSLETKAQIYTAEGNYRQALETIEQAISILQKSENTKYLTEAYLTKAKILLYTDDFCSAFMCLSDAVQKAKDKISEEIALNLVKDFEAALKEKNSEPVPKVEFDNNRNLENLELILPPSMAHYQKIEVIRIQNSHLEKVGLCKGALAIAVEETIRRGDLAAVLEKESGAVSCGFYDFGFGIVGLDGFDVEPQLFDENNIEIIGKIIGICKNEKNPDGKLFVELLNLN